MLLQDPVVNPIQHLLGYISSPDPFPPSQDTFAGCSHADLYGEKDCMLKKTLRLLHPPPLSIYYFLPKFKGASCSSCSGPGEQVVISALPTQRNHWAPNCFLGKPARARAIHLLSQIFPITAEKINRFGLA